MTPEQREAQDQLQAAIERHVAAFRPVNRIESEMVADWALIANVVYLDKDGDRWSLYHVAYPNGETDDHRAIGLFTHGANLVMRGVEQQ